MAGFGAFLTHVFFSLPQQEEKIIFNTSIIFDFISNYTNYIHIKLFITCQLFPTGYFLRLISLLGDLKCS